MLDATIQDPLVRAMSLPGGARFHRCALQVNPHEYASNFRGGDSEGDARSHATTIIQKAADLGVTVLAITDHNHVGGVQAFRDAAGPYPEIHVFPGFELKSSEGVHVLCIYPQETEGAQLERYLGELGIRRTSPSSDPCGNSFSDVLGKVRDQGGLAIAAHATNKGGLLTVLEGQPRMRAWRDENLLAIQIPGSVEDLPQQYRQIVENRNPDYRREHPPEDDLAVAVVNAKDVVRAEDLEDPASTCLIKMSEVSIEGLRQAFLDPGSRIRLSSGEDAAEGETHAEFLAMAWEGGFLDGCAVRFNPNLNVLVGGRGAGKSTIIESLRAALGLEVPGDDARRAHEGIVRQVLQNGTKISLRVRVSRPGPREYTIERTIPNPPRVRDGGGEISNLTPLDILPQVEIYGQHELSELAKSRQKLTGLLHRFVERGDSFDRRKGELRRELKKNRQSLLETREEVRRLTERLAQLPVLEETLGQFREAGLEDRLQEKSLLVREEQLLDSIPERLEFAEESLGALKESLPIDRVFLSGKALEGLPGRELLEEADGVLSRLSEDLEAVTEDLEAALGRAHRDLEAVRDKWEKRKSEVQATYEKILRELQKSQVDGEEFIQLRRQIESLRPLRQQLTRLQEKEEQYDRRRGELLAQWKGTKAEEFRELERAARKVGGMLRDDVEVRVLFAGNREPLLELLQEEVGGRLAETIQALQTAEDLSLSELVASCRKGPGALQEAYGLTSTQADRLAAAEENLLFRVEELDLPSTTEIRLNLAPPGEAPVWKKLEDLSTGQKATAVLLLLLLDSDAPLVVDQPEDDLDNRFITEGVVPRMREAKQRRQFVFSTHNANIPVLGDAELIVGLSAEGEAEHGCARIRREHMGSIDDRSVRGLVESILEGGKEAFERRRRKYGY